jgi:hypothetical protein
MKVIAEQGAQADQLVESFKASGMTQREFCLRHDVPFSRLKYYLAKQRKVEQHSFQTTHGQAGQTKFATVQVINSPQSTSKTALDYFLIKLKNETELSIPFSADLNKVKLLLDICQSAHERDH